MSVVGTILGRWHRAENPLIRSIRATLSENRILRAILRRISPDAFEGTGVMPQAPSPDLRLSAIFRARFVGGGLSLADLDRLWALRGKNARVFCVGEPAALEQMEIVLTSGETRSITKAALHPLPAPDDFRRFDLVVIATDAKTLADVERLKAMSRLGSNFFVLIDEHSRRSQYHFDRHILSEKAVRSNLPLRDALENNERIRIVMLNDVGFQYGAGIAQKRQAASLLLNGWDVAAMAWTPGNELTPPPVSGVQQFDNWHGEHMLLDLSVHDVRGGPESVDHVVSKIKSFEPDVVIVGNIHGANWPISLLSRLQEFGALVIVYMHDCYYVTGRCAYPGTCVSFRTGCDEQCPTADQYPPLEPSRISGAWKNRAEAFTGAQPVPLVANSRWTRDIARQRFGTAAQTDVVHLGLDETLFAPVDKRTARDLLGVAPDKTVIAMGAVDMENRWKGGPVFRAIYDALQSRGDVEMMVFGRASESFTAAKTFGLVRDERLMPLIYGAADIFVSTGTEEAFGQTLLEASACGVPVVAFNVGGVSDVVVHGETGLLVSVSENDMLAAIDRLIREPALRAHLAARGRARVEKDFSLARQAAAWADCLRRLS